MKILLTDIAGESQSFNFSETLEFPGDGFELKAPVQARIMVRQQSEMLYILSGDLQAFVDSACDRCGKSIYIDLNQNFEYILRLEEEPQLTAEYQCSDKECETLFLAEASFESRTILAEQLLLGMPLQRLCVKTCKGLCKECGINLNENKCQCGEINTNSPFAILKTLQKK